jgi:hypothetical protein
MAAMKLAAIAWIIFIGGMAALIAGDALVRFRAGTFGQSGLPTPDVIWFGAPAILATVAVGLLWRSTVSMRYVWQRVLVVAAQMLVGFIVYMLVVFWYVIGTGIDAI